HDAPLDLRDRLLGDHDDVALLEHNALRDQRAEVVALGHLGQPLDGQNPQLADASTASASRRRAGPSTISVFATTTRSARPSTAAASASSMTSASISPL